MASLLKFQKINVFSDGCLYINLGLNNSSKISVKHLTKDLVFFQKNAKDRTRKILTESDDVTLYRKSYLK